MALLAQVSTQALYTKYLEVSSITGGNSLNTTQLFSTVGGLGQIYISTGGGGGITTSNLQSTVAGLGQIYLSTAGGGITSIPSTLSTFAIFTSSLQTSTINSRINQSESTLTSSFNLTGTGIVKFNGTNSASLYGYGVDSLTLQTTCNSYVGGIASLAFATATSAYPLGRIYAVDSATSGSPLSQLVFQNIPVSATSFNSTYSYTGSDQTFTVPAGVTSMQVTLWGAGGGGSGSGGIGAAGAFVQGILTVQAGQTYKIIVGQGGQYLGTTAPYGGGGAASSPSTGGSSGGGRSGLQVLLTAQITSASGSGSAITFTTNISHGLLTGRPITISGLSPAGFNGNFAVASTPASNQFTVVSTQSGSSTGTGTIYAEVVNVGGGGGGGWNASAGPAAFSGSGTNGQSAGGNPGGTGGSQSSGGVQNGGILKGGNVNAGNDYAGGGGGGFYGGGSGTNNPGLNTGGGGGSSYTSFSGFSLQTGSNSPNSLNQAPATSVTGYVAGVAVGGALLGNGGNGLIILTSIGGSITEAMRIGSNGYLGVATATPSYQLDVAGTGRLSNLYLGTNSTIVSQQFYGLFGNYNNTVIAEVSTGGGTQELLMFKGSSTSDRVRIQTTGNFVVETGVTSRLWASNGLSTLSNATPALIVNTSSNVGIQTATPATTLDVAGTGRFQLTSTLGLNLSSLNGGIPLVNADTDSSIVVVSAITGQSIFSYDGRTWFKGAGNGGQAHGLAYNGYYWISGTEGGIYRSADGINWSATTFTSTATSAVAWNGNLWVVGGWYGGMWYSYDGYTWTACPQAPTQTVQDIVWGNDKFIAACAGAVYYSYDGLYWYSLGNILAGGDQTYCVAYNGLIWLIGGRYATVANIAYSYDGIRWFNTAFNSFNVIDFAWSGTTWVATTGTNQTVITSPDGITWTQRTNPFILNLGNAYVTWNGAFFYVASDDQFYISRSTDGITWSLVSSGLGSQPRKIKARMKQPINGAKQTAGIYSQNIFMGISTNQTVMRFPGPDALYRNTVIGELSSQSTQYASELVLFKGSTVNDRIRLQATGEIRFEAGVPSRFFSSISSVASVAVPAFIVSTNSNVGIGTALPAATLDVVGTGRFQTVSTLALNISSINGSIYTSGGGGTATGSSLTVSTGSATISSLVTSSILNYGSISTYSLTVYGASTMTVQGWSFFQNVLSSQTLITTGFAILDSVSGQPTYITSSNGQLGPAGTSYTTTINLTSTVANLGQTYLSTPSLVSTVDNLGQTYISTPSLVSTVAGLGQTYISTATGSASFPSTVSTSYALSFTTSSLIISSINGQVYTAGGSASFPSTVSTSYGSAFNTFLMNASTVSQVNILPSSSNLWVAAGYDTNPSLSIKYSTDGFTWVTASGATFSLRGQGVAYNGFQWVCVGNDTTANNTIKYSGDGRNWSNAASGGFTGSAQGIAWNGRIWIAGGIGGGNTLKYSGDGSNWSNVTSGTFTSAAYGVAWNGFMWVALGSDLTASTGIRYSYDGLNWLTTSGTSFNTAGIAAAWNGKLWIAVGVDSTAAGNIKYSYDGINWSNSVSNSFETAGRGIAWNGRMWVAAGTGFAFLKYSFDGLNWSDAASGDFVAGTGFSITWNGSLWMAIGQDSTQNNTIKYSYNGINWSNSSGTGYNQFGYATAFSSNITPSYRQRYFEIQPQGIPLFLRSTNTMTFTTSTMILNNALTIDGVSDRVGINTGNPQTDLDVFGIGRFLTLSTQQLNASSITAPLFSSLQSFQSSIFANVIQVSTLSSLQTLASSIFAPVVQASTVSSFQMNTSSIITNFMQTARTSTLQLIVSSISQVTIPQTSSNLWIAVGSDGTNASSIRYSYNGINWSNTLISTSFYNNGIATAWNGQMWVAIGSDPGISSIKYSFNGFNWANTAGPGFTGQGSPGGVAWNGRMWVAVGNEATGTSTIKYSFNGINWSNVLNGFGGFGAGVAWNGNMWVAAGIGSGNNTLKYSYNGINWSDSVSGGFAGLGNAVAWGGNMWVAVGYDTNQTTAVKYSYDGLNWSNSLGNTFTAITTNGVAWNGIMWVAVASQANSSIKYSYDGLNWSNVFNSFTSLGSAISWNGNMWVAGGTDTTANNRLKYSFDGVTWSNAGSGGMTTSGLAFSSNLVPSYSQRNFEIQPQTIPLFLRSTNQMSFTQSSIILNDTLIVDSVNRVGINTGNPQTDLDVAGGGRFQTLSTYTLNVSSISLVTISSITQINIPQSYSNLWVAGGNPQNTVNPFSSLAYSYNGINWQSPINSFGFTGGVNGVAWNGTMWVAVGSDTNTANNIQYSYNGFNWNQATGVFAGSGNDVAWNGNIWVAVGQDPSLSNGTIKYSGNGINWSNAASGGFPSLVGRGVAWNGSMWVAVGQDKDISSIKYSYNGINWSNTAGVGFLAGGRGIAWNGDMWLALGSNAVGNTSTILYSYNGINWTRTTSAFTGAAAKAAWNGRMWVAVGEGVNSTIKYSYDGINWSNVFNAFPASGLSIAWNGQQWVAGGQDATSVAASTMKYSYDGITWATASNNGVSFQFASAVAYSSNLTPSYAQSNFEIQPQNIPVFLRQRNQMSFTQSSIILNNTLFTDVANRVGVNTGNPQTEFDVAGTGRFQITSTLQLYASSIIAPYVYTPQFINF